MAQPILQDVVNIIIDFLQDDKQSLMGCSCVCRSWTHSARAHLFKSIRVESRRSELVFTLINLGSFLRHTPAIRSFIRKLRVGSRHSNFQVNVNAPLLHSVTSFLVSLDVLVLRGVNLVGTDDPSLADHPFEHPISPVPIKKLALTSIDSPHAGGSLRALVAILRVFSRIDELRCWTVFWQELSSPEDDANLSIDTAIDTLIVHNSPWLATPLFNLLTKSSTVQNLSHISWDAANILEWPSYHSLVNRAQSLRSLTYDLPTGSRVSEISRHLSDPSSYRDLRSIQFRFCSNAEAGERFDLAYRVLSLYSTPASLRELHYEICISRYSVLGIMELSNNRWDLFEELVEREYIGLERVVFTLSSNDELNEFDDAIDISCTHVYLGC